MKIINIKVSALTKKSILYEYTKSFVDTTLFLLQTDQLLFLLTAKHSTQQLDFKTLSDSIELAVPTSKFPLISPQIGMHLHKYHQLQMCREVSNETDLKIWLQVRNIQAHEYSFETAVKYFNRFKKKTAKSCRDIKINVPPNGKFILSPFTPLSMEQAETLIFKFIERNPTHFLTVAKSPHKRLIKQLEIYVYREFAKISPREIELRFKIPERTQRHSVRNFKQFLSSTKNLIDFQSL